MIFLHIQTSLQKHQLVHNWWNNLFAMAPRVLMLHCNVSSNETKSHIIEQHRVRSESTNEPSQIHSVETLVQTVVLLWWPVPGAWWREKQTRALLSIMKTNSKFFFWKWRNFHPNRLIKRVRENHPTPIRVQSSFIFFKVKRLSSD